MARHYTTNGVMVLAKSASDLMQRLPRLPTSPHVALLLRGKPKPSPWSHKHHLWKQLYTRWCCIDRLNRHDLPGLGNTRRTWQRIDAEFSRVKAGIAQAIGRKCCASVSRKQTVGNWSL